MAEFCLLEMRSVVKYGRIFYAGLVLGMLPAIAPASGPDWSYSGENGPANWGKLRPAYARCANGKRQSPIDIVATQKQALPAIRFDYHPASLHIVNDGHTVRVRFANGSRIVLGKESYLLQQMHFHIPGGDKIGGQEFEMGMHLVHKSSAGHLMVVVVLFRTGAPNPALAALLPTMPAHQSGEQSIPAVMADAMQFLPAARGYVAYDGSLTAPPCTEGISWLVLKQPLELSADQLAQLSSFFPRNARPVQPLNGRVLKESQ